MSDSVLTYIQAASKLLKAHYQLVLFPISISLIGSITNILSEGNLDILSLLPTLLMLAIMPTVYGRFNEIVTKKRFVSWKYLLDKFFLKYLGFVFTITLIMSIPTFLFSMLMISSQAVHYPKFIFAFILLIYHVLGLYAVPLLFYDNTIKQSLILGFKCLVGNFQYNLPLILLSVLISLFSIPHTQSDFELLNTLFRYIRWSILFVLDFMIFIAITLILKDKIYSSQEF